MAYDSATQATVLFGGAAGDVIFGDTWSWNGARWTQEFPATSPPARAYAQIAYDARHDRLVLFGGFDGRKALGDTWIWDGLNWTEQNPAASPSPREEGAMAYDDGLGVVILFSGNPHGFTSPPDDTWSWDGATWTQLRPNASPPPTELASIVSVTGSTNLVMFGGFAWGAGQGTAVRDLWLFDGSTWRLEPPPAGAPVPSTGVLSQTATGDPLLFGGQSGSETWRWSRCAWSELVPNNSPPPGAAAIAYDARLGVVVMFGSTKVGDRVSSGTWTWDGRNWKLQSP